MSIEFTNHFEISDGDTLIVTCRACTLSVKNVDSSLVINDRVCCVQGNAKCNNFYKMWHDSSDHKTWIQCTMLSDINEEVGSPIALDVTPVEKYCNTCANMVVPSLNPEYTWQCHHCDEDLYTHEVHTK